MFLKFNHRFTTETIPIIDPNLWHFYGCHTFYGNIGRGMQGPMDGDRPTVESVQIVKGDTWIHGRPNRSKFLIGINGPPINN